MPDPTLGVDVSEFAGVPDYEALRAAGAQFVIPRLTAGLVHVDKLVDAQLAAARAAGVHALGGYHYLYSWRSGALQAEHAHREMLRRGLATVFLDVEPVASGPARATDAPHLARLTARDFAVRWAELTGRSADLYGAVYYVRDLDVDGDQFRCLWGAQVGAKGKAFAGKPYVPAPFGSLLIHQYQHNAVFGRGAVDWNRTPLTLEQLVAVLAGEDTPAALAEAWGLMMTTSDLAAGLLPGQGPEAFGSP